MTRKGLILHILILGLLPIILAIFTGKAPLLERIEVQIVWTNILITFVIIILLTLGGKDGRNNRR